MNTDWRETYKADLAELKDVPEEFQEQYKEDLREFKEYHENLEKEENRKRGYLIKTIRKYRNLTQAQLGSMCGMSASQIRNYELGFRKPKIETLNKIANALGVSSDFISLSSRFLDDSDLAVEYIELNVNNTDFINEQKKELSVNIPLHVLKGYVELNKNGQNKVEEYIKELLEMPKYTKKEE